MPRLKFPKYTVIVVLASVAAFLIYFPSYSRYRELKIESEKLEKHLKSLQAEIQELQHERLLMKNDKNYLEMVIRKELGLVEPGEIVYEFQSRKQTAGHRLPKSTKASKTDPKTTVGGSR